MHESEACIEYVLLTTFLSAGESLLMLTNITVGAHHFKIIYTPGLWKAVYRAYPFNQLEQLTVNLCICAFQYTVVNGTLSLFCVSTIPLIVDTNDCGCRA